MRLRPSITLTGISRAAAVLALLIIAPARVRADARSDELQRCLADFDGIAWQLPYSPMLAVNRCASAGGSYNDNKTADAAHASIEMIQLGNLVDSETMGGAALFSAKQNAVFAHFDWLFKRSGYTRTEIRYAEDNRTYVRDATYRRASETGTSVLSFAVEMGNTWRLRVEHQPASGS